jgi:hypothetical protein
MRTRLGVYMRWGTDPMATGKYDEKHTVGRTQEGFPWRKHVGEQWHRGYHHSREGLMGEIADVWQPRRMVGIRAGVVVVMCLMWGLVMKDACCQADGGYKKQQERGRA